MKNKVNFANKIISLMLVALIISTSIFGAFFTPLKVYASSPIIPTVTETDVIFGALESLGYLIGASTGIWSSADDGNPFTEHDFAKFAYDFLVDIGFNDVALDTIWSIAYLDSDWDKPKSYDQLSQKTLSEITRDQIDNYKKTGEIPDIFVKYNSGSKGIFDTLPDFVSSVLDGTNTLKLGNKTITADAITGFDDYQMDANGNYIVNIIASYVGGGYACVDSYLSIKPVLVRSGPNVNGVYSFEYMRKSNLNNSLISWNFLISYCATIGSEPTSTKAFSALSSYDSLPISSSIPIFDSRNDALNFINYGTRTGMINDASSSTGKFDYTAIANNVVSKIFPLITGAAISVKGLYDAYAGTRDKIKGGSITDTPAYIDSVVNVMQGIQTLDKVIAGEETPTLPDSGADILEWVKTIASAVVVIPTELRKLSLSALESSVGAIADVFPALRQDLKAIADSFPALRQDVKTIGDIFPALRSDLKGIADDFPAVRKTLDAIGDSFPALKQGLDSITDVFPSMVDYQARFLPKIGDISDTLNALSARYKELVDSLADFFPDIRDKLGSILGVLDIPLGGVLDLPLSGIADKVDGISDSLAGLKDFTLTIPDYTGILGKILAVLEAIRALVQFLVDWFTIDPVLLSDTLEDAVTDIKYSTGLEPLLAFFERFKFTDDYTYPRIVMGVPDYVKAYYPYDEIVLVDFGDYAKYFVYTRTMLKFCLWFTFALVQFKHIKVHYHIG